MYRKILVPVDGSESSTSVLPLIGAVAGSLEADIVLLRVIEYPSSLYPPCYEYPIHDLREMEMIQKNKKIIRQQVKSYLGKLAASIAADGIRVDTELCEGPVVEAILEAADRLETDLIALAAFGRTGAMPGMIGSVADRILYEAKIPVMLFRPTNSPERLDPAFNSRGSVMA